MVNTREIGIQKLGCWLFSFYSTKLAILKNGL